MGQQSCNTIDDERQQHSGDDGGDVKNRPTDALVGGPGDNQCKRVNVLRLLLWVLSLGLLSCPSFIYGLTTVIPTQDSIFGGNFITIASTIHAAAPIIITFINSVIVPAVVVYCCDRSRWQSARLLLVSRLLTTWLVPVVVIVVFSDSCGRMWLRLWAQCLPERRHELDVWGPSGDAVFVAGSMCFVDQGQTYYNGYINRTVLVSGSDICDPSTGSTNQPYAQCGCAVVEAMAPLLVGKMALATLVLPAFTIFKWRIAPRGWSAFSFDLLRRCRSRCRADSSTNDAHGDDNRETHTIKGPRVDNCVAQILTWLDVALVFGPHIPLLMPLVLAALVMERWTHENVGLRRLGLPERRAEFSKPSTWYVLFSVVCQQLLAVSVFAGVEGSDGGKRTHGWMVVTMTVVGGLVTIACVAVAVVPIIWLHGAGRWCHSCCVHCRRCCRNDGAERRAVRNSTAELSDRSLLEAPLLQE